MEEQSAATIAATQILTPSSSSQFHSSGLLTPKCRLEISPNSTKVWIPNCLDELKPFVGKKFANLHGGVGFYKCYARACGFNVRMGTERKSNDGVITLKYVFCSKEGYNPPKEMPEEVGSTNNKSRKRATTRVGCKAKIVFKFCGQEGYGVFSFEERHTHCLSTPSGLQFLRANRDLNISHKKFIVDCAKVNIGPVKSYRIYKETVGGYNNIGATMVDFKNFHRDLKAYIGGADAQMIIENFFRKKEICSAFYFDYDVDDTNTLTRLFWADPISRKNYALFGDMVSFDATYGTNRYNMVFAPFTGVDHHKRCVTFGAGLLSKEDVDSYSWLFDTFLKSMGHEPNCIVTDQDPAMKIAIEKVFHKTHHRYCMWHIMKKLSDKVGHSISKNTDFLSKISSVVWNNNIEPEEFEALWITLISEFHLEENAWLSHMFEIRNFWIPAYFRDLFMGGLLRTTSRSESENNFFSNFTNPFVTLVEFMMRFESAMDAQRHSQAKLNNNLNTSSPVLKTPLGLEKHASEIYTHSIFYEIQEEICAACFSCGVETMTKSGEVCTYIISEVNKKSSKVVHNSSNLDTTCSCKKFTMFGILCRHILWVFKGIEKMPEQFIVNRWTKNATKEPIFALPDNILEESVRMEERKMILNELWSDIHCCVGMVEQNDNDMKIFLQHIKTFKDDLLARKSVENPTSKSKVIESLIGSGVPNEVRVQHPRVSKNKGSGKRLKGEKEKAVEQLTKNKRLCRTCGELGYHDSRTCKSKLSS